MSQTDSASMPEVKQRMSYMCHQIYHYLRTLIEKIVVQKNFRGLHTQLPDVCLDNLVELEVTQPRPYIIECEERPYMAAYLENALIGPKANGFSGVPTSMSIYIDCGLSISRPCVTMTSDNDSINQCNSVMDVHFAAPRST